MSGSAIPPDYPPSASTRLASAPAARPTRPRRFAIDATKASAPPARHPCAQCREPRGPPRKGKGTCTGEGQEPPPGPAQSPDDRLEGAPAPAPSDRKTSAPAPGEGTGPPPHGYGSGTRSDSGPASHDNGRRAPRAGPKVHPSRSPGSPRDRGRDHTTVPEDGRTATKGQLQDHPVRVRRHDDSPTSPDANQPPYDDHAAPPGVANTRSGTKGAGPDRRMPGTDGRAVTGPPRKARGDGNPSPGPRATGTHGRQRGHGCRDGNRRPRREYQDKYRVPWKGTVPQRVRIPPGKLSLQPVAIGADDGGNDIVRSTSVERVA